VDDSEFNIDDYAEEEGDNEAAEENEDEDER
jgi:hypothetical protein